MVISSPQYSQALSIELKTTPLVPGRATHVMPYRTAFLRAGKCRRKGAIADQARGRAGYHGDQNFKPRSTRFGGLLGQSVITLGLCRDHDTAGAA